MVFAGVCTKQGCFLWCVGHNSSVTICDLKCILTLTYLLEWILHPMQVKNRSSPFQWNLDYLCSPGLSLSLSWGWSQQEKRELSQTSVYSPEVRAEDTESKADGGLAHLSKFTEFVQRWTVTQGGASLWDVPGVWHSGVIRLLKGDRLIVGPQTQDW